MFVLKGNCAVSDSAFSATHGSVFATMSGSLPDAAAPDARERLFNIVVSRPRSALPPLDGGGGNILMISSANCKPKRP